MDDKILFYIILGVVYVLFNWLKKGKGAKEQEYDSSGESSPQGNPPKSISFEDLLREITEAKKQSQALLPKKLETAKPVTSYVDYDDNLEEEEKNIEKAAIDDDFINKTYEEAKAMAFKRPLAEETAPLKDIKLKSSKFKEFEAKGHGGFLKEITNDLRYPRTLKRAVVLSEILNRRHF